MVLGFLKSSQAPIAIDFGYSTIKALQLAPLEKPTLGSAACVEIPDGVRQDQNARAEFLADQLPRLLRNGKFKGRTAVCSIPAWQTFVQHMRIPKSEEGDMQSAIVGQLQSIIECDPESVVIRHFRIAETYANGQPAVEVLCVAVARDIVMKQLELLRRCKLEIGGLHSEPVALVRAFDYIHHRNGDDQITSMYVDIGANCARAVISHGRELRFARSIGIGGRQFDQKCADKFGCEVVAARHRRLAVTSKDHVSADRVLYATASLGKNNTASANAAEGSQKSITGMATSVDQRIGKLPVGVLPAPASPIVDEPGSAPAGAGLTGDAALVRAAEGPLVEQLVEELRMCVRYHRHLFPDRYVDRLFFVGGESRDGDLCREVADRLGVCAYIADPLRRLARDGSETISGLEGLDREPGWTVPLGLCQCPADV